MRAPASGLPSGSSTWPVTDIISGFSNLPAAEWDGSFVFAVAGGLLDACVSACLIGGVVASIRQAHAPAPAARVAARSKATAILALLAVIAVVAFWANSATDAETMPVRASPAAIAKAALSVVAVSPAGSA